MSLGTRMWTKCDWATPPQIAPTNSSPRGELTTRLLRRGERRRGLVRRCIIYKSPMRLKASPKNVDTLENFHVCYV